MRRISLPAILAAVFLWVGIPNCGYAASVKCFTLTFSLDLSNISPRPLLEIPGVVRVNIADGLQMQDDGGQNYAAFPTTDGSVPVLEAALRLRLPVGNREVQEMKVGVPLSLLTPAKGQHSVKLSFSGARWTMFVDGKLVDNDFPLGYPEGDLSTPVVKEPTVTDIGLTDTASICERPERSLTAQELQYFTPEGHNAWVGDVATCFYKGRYHLFYLYDRRGHRSKFGRGGHYFEHLSTSDFLTWTEHPAATPIEEQWETFGTGTPFVWHDSLFLSYGMHTSRIYPEEVTASPMQWQYIRDHGESRAITFKSIEGLYPSGASYSVATPDGAHFTKTHVLIHPAENPTIYTDEEGRLMMLANYGARGMWTSNRIEGGWRCLSEDFPPGGDCTFLFHWGDYDYIVGGFTHMWMKRASQPVESYVDMVAQGMDFYDGLSVPAFTRLPSGRVIMAGWMKLNNWGGPLVLRELIQEADGRIGSHFLPEMMQFSGKPKTLCASAVKDGQPLQLPASSGLLTFDVIPDADGRVDLTFMNATDGKNAFTWTIDLKEQRAQFSSEPDEKQKTLREGGQPQQAFDYAIDHLDLTQGNGKQIPIRIILRNDAKFTGTIADVEIGGRRTMITYRHDLKPCRMTVRSSKAKIQNVRFCRN